MGRTTSDAINISGPIDPQLADRVLHAILSRREYYKEDSLHLRIDSPGGQLEPMWRIVEAIEESKAMGVEVWTLGDGTVASAAAILASSGSPGCREATARTRILYHEPRYVPPEETVHTAQKLHVLTSALLHRSEEILDDLVAWAGIDPATGPVLARNEDLPKSLIRALDRTLDHAPDDGEAWDLRQAYEVLLELDEWITPEAACALGLIDRVRPSRSHRARRLPSAPERSRERKIDPLPASDPARFAAAARHR